MYSPLRIDSHLYILKATLTTNLSENLSIVIRQLFRRRKYSALKYCHMAWDRIIFFIFQQDAEYCIDCVDILEPDRIFFYIVIIEKYWQDLICFDKEEYLHHIGISVIDNKNFHAKFNLKSALPQPILDYQIQRIKSVVEKYCSLNSRLYKISQIPIVLINLIFKFHPNFGS